MELIASTGVPLLIVNLVFAAIALAIGFAAGAWVCGAKPAADGPANDPDAAKAEAESQKLSVERTLLASDRLRDLAAAVASDVGQHNASITAIEARLAGDHARGVTAADSVLVALAEISRANEALQSKLVKAEEQIQDQAELIRTHESEARTDSLTGLANRRAFDDEISRRFAEWERKGTPFALLILDVDHFKRFNDTHGHQAGDEVLRHVAKAIARCARDMDLACRYGGEEFAVILPATEGIDGCPLAERIRTTVQAIEVSFGGKTLSVTTSLGLAGVQPEDGVASLIRRADEALYAAKDAGRNRSHRHTGAETVPISPGATRPAAATPAAATPTRTLDSLPNRTRFLESLRTEVRIAQEASLPLSVLTAEFTGYLRLSDEFGEAVARLTLDSIAQFLDNSIQEHDQLARLEDGQFAILMPHRTEADAMQIGERISAALANCSVPLGDGLLRLETTMRAAQMTDADTSVTLMNRLEQAFIARKSAAAGV